jgi:hypothetical protein
MLIDKSIFSNEKELEISGETKHSLQRGTEDSQSIIKKMSCLNYDYQRLELQKEIRFK